METKISSVLKLCFLLQLLYLLLSIKGKFRETILFYLVPSKIGTSIQAPQVCPRHFCAPSLSSLLVALVRDQLGICFRSAWCSTSARCDSGLLSSWWCNPTTMQRFSCSGRTYGWPPSLWVKSLAPSTRSFATGPACTDRKLRLSCRVGSN